jgi:phenylacetate-CoA ligase
LTDTPSSSVPGIAWPALPGAAGQRMLAMQFQLERCQWWRSEDLLAQQFRQLRRVLSHAVQRVPHYRHALAQAADLRSLEDLNEESYLRWPRLTRAGLQERFEALKATSYPREHGTAQEVFTSGSTGSPVRVLTTQAAQFFQQALVLRDHLWHGRDFGAKLGAIRFNVSETRQPGWSTSTNAAFATGPAVLLDLGTDVGAQLEWLLRERPGYLLTTPSNLAALVAESNAPGRSPTQLRQVITYAEVLPEGLRETLGKAWNVPLVDGYSCRELGPLALQCPQAEHYHVQSEHVYLEVLDDAGRPCGPGETGRIVVTSLHDFAMPLLRYEIGDYAEVGAPCHCGRGLPVLRKILGRSRNMARALGGRRFQPALDKALEAAGVPIGQLQLVQRALDALECRYVGEPAITAAGRERLAAALRKQFGPGCAVTFTRVDRIPRAPSGKYESFLCEIEA